jgi:hypothetical protein
MIKPIGHRLLLIAFVSDLGVHPADHNGGFLHPTRLMRTSAANGC